VVTHLFEEEKTKLPYPDGAVKEKNAEYAALLMPLFAGRNSEMSAFQQYLYQYWLTLDAYPELALTLERMASEEDQHMRILGELITALGGEPILRVGGRHGHGYYWTGEYVRQTRGVSDFLRENIAAEKNAIAEYNRRLKAIDDPYIRDVLARIMTDEQEHLRLLEAYEARIASYGR